MVLSPPLFCWSILPLFRYVTLPWCQRCSYSRNWPWWRSTAWVHRGSDRHMCCNKEDDDDDDDDDVVILFIYVYIWWWYHTLKGVVVVLMEVVATGKRQVQSGHGQRGLLTWRFDVYQWLAWRRYWGVDHTSWGWVSEWPPIYRETGGGRDACMLLCIYHIIIPRHREREGETYACSYVYIFIIIIIAPCSWLWWWRNIT